VNEKLMMQYERTAIKGALVFSNPLISGIAALTKGFTGHFFIKEHSQD